MDFTLDKKYEMAQTLFKDFAQNEVKPLAQEIDEHFLYFCKPVPSFSPFIQLPDRQRLFSY